MAVMLTITKKRKKEATNFPALDRSIFKKEIEDFTELFRKFC